MGGGHTDRLANMAGPSSDLVSPPYGLQSEIGPGWTLPVEEIQTWRISKCGPDSVFLNL